MGMGDEIGGHDRTYEKCESTKITAEDRHRLSWEVMFGENPISHMEWIISENEKEIEAQQKRVQIMKKILAQKEGGRPGKKEPAHE